MSTIAALPPSYFSWQIPEIFAEPVNKATKIWERFQSILGTPVQEIMLPRTQTLCQEHIYNLNKEKHFFDCFWDPSHPVNPHLPYHAAIRKHFVWRTESQPIEVQGKPLSVEYSIIEPARENATQNFVLLLGNLSVHDDNITGVYPFLVSYMKEKEKNPKMPAVRFVLISQYDTKTQNNEKYKAHNLDEMGHILAKTLLGLQKEKGSIQQLMGYSLGTIALSAALPYIPAEDLPKNIYWDRGPSSLEIIGRSHGLKGWFLWHCAKFSGWDFDLGVNIRKYLANRKDQKIYIAEVEHDCYFPKQASLVSSEHLKNLGKEHGFHTFSFDFAKQLHDDRAHHGLHNGLLDHYHLKHPKSTELKTHESMADLLIRGLPKNQPTQKSLFKWAFSK